jgi:hypothetical protein
MSTRYQMRNTIARLRGELIALQAISPEQHPSVSTSAWSDRSRLLQAQVEMIAEQLIPEGPLKTPLFSGEAASITSIASALETLGR